MPKLIGQKDPLKALHSAQVKQGEEIASLRAEITTLVTDVGAFHTEMAQGFRDLDRRLSFMKLGNSNLATEVDSLQRHVRGLDTEVRDGFARMTDLLTKDTAN